MVVWRGGAMTKQTRTRFLALIIGLAVGVRVALAIVHGFPFPDSRDYDALARTIVAGGPYQVNHLYATRMPGYPIFVAVIYAIFGAPAPDDLSLPVLIAQGILGGITVWLTYSIGRRISVRVGLIAALLAALDPLCIGFSATMLTESCFTLLLLVAIWLAVRLIERPHVALWLLLGAVWGAGVYFRASALWGIVLITAWVAWMQFRSERKTALKASLGGAAAAVAIACLMLLPWCLRNEQIFHGGFFRLTTLEGISLYEAVYPEADGSPRQNLIQPPPEMQQLNEAQLNDEWSRRAWGYVLGDPGRMLKLAAIKIARTWAPWFNTSEIPSPALFWGMTIFYVPLFAGAIFGIATRGAPKYMTGLLLAPIVYFTLVHAFYLGSVRYRAPLMPLVCIRAATGIMTLWQRIQGKPRPLATV